MTSGTATTTTTTATSTSPTATSTTSRSSTPAATRPTATRTRARTRSGRTAGRPSRTRARARRATRTAARRSAPPACGSRTTRSSPRTAASPCSRTSTATTSACPTTTTPPPRPDNAVNWWTLMAQSRVSRREDQGIGTRAADLGAWDKLQLGWLDYEIVVAGQNRTLDLGPHECNTAKAQGVVVVLPQKTVTTPARRARRRHQAVVLGHGRRLRGDADAPGRAARRARATLSFQARWNIEDCGPDACDYAYVEVDDGTATRRSRARSPRPPRATASTASQAARSRRRSTCRPTPARRSRCASTTRPTARPRAPSATEPPGLFLDEIKLTNGHPDAVHRRRRERRQRLDADRLQRSSARRHRRLRPLLRRVQPHVHVARPLPADRAVQLRLPGPARLGRALPVPERAAGLLLGHVVHRQQREPAPGPGRDPADRRQPAPIYRLDGKPWRGRIQTYDAPFGLEKSDSFTLHAPNGRPSYIRGQAAQPLFDDRSEYWDPALPPSA